MSPCSDSLSLRLPYPVKLASKRKSLTHYTKGTQSPQLNQPSLGVRLAHGSVSSMEVFCRRAINPRGRQSTAQESADLLHRGGLLPPRDKPARRQRRLIELGLPLFVCMRFQDLFHSPSGVLFAFPSRYWFTIGRLRVFSLGGWSPHLQTGFHVSRPTSRKPGSTTDFSRTGLSPTTAALSRAFH
jgi:hypothetical protein